MVTALSYVPAKKSKLSLFRFAKSSSSSKSCSNPPVAQKSGSRSQPSTSQHATPRQPPAVDPVLYQYPSSTSCQQDNHTYATYPALTRLRTDKHSRQRSHFSIPDVIVTTCEEDGQRDVVELSIPPGKRRSCVVQASSQDLASQATKKHATRPPPLISFDSEEEVKGVSKSSSLSSFSSSDSPKQQRTRKRSFGLLFGRKSLESAPPTPTGLLFSANNHSGSVGLPTPPVTPTSPVAAGGTLTKKQIKAKAKQELALIKELERVDRLVKQHDAKARKREEKERSRLAKTVQPRGTDVAQSGGEGGSLDLLRRRSKRKTVFHAASKTSTSGALARRTSIKVSAPTGGENGTYVYERMGSEPILSHTPKVRATAFSPFSVGLASGERLPFSAPSAAIPSSHPPPPQDPIAIVDLTDVSVAADEDADETLRHWNHSNWSQLEDEFSGPLPSLINPSGTASTLASSQLEHDDEQRRVKMERRASVQRVLALRRISRQASATAGNKRRSSVFDPSFDVASQSESVGSSKRSSRRRSFISQALAEGEAWSIVPTDDAEWARVDESTIAQPDVDGDGENWIEDLASSPLTESVSEVDLVLADLKAAQKADADRLELGHGHAEQDSGERTPTQKMVCDPFKSTTMTKSTSPSRPIRARGRADAASSSSPTKALLSSSLSSVDSFALISSGTNITEPPLFSPSQTEFLTDKEAEKSQFRLLLALAPLQPIELCAKDDWGS